ncbi:MAG: trypsin-like peptidase domain-containing protein, partial [Sphaerochaetaceae bacterium]|nr:trypsin-like peptidase domain-containing protein [Sphaerochaetaceae bacterium]
EVYETRPTLNSGTRLNIIQHPGGGIKQFGIRSNHYVSPADPKSPYVQYTTHTEAGSSGSPVFDDRWRVIAIHHRWVQVEQHTYQGESVQYHNQGVYLDSVLKDIASKSPAMYEQICQAQEECRS